jgi:hypothetical protein
MNVKKKKKLKKKCYTVTQRKRKRKKKKERALFELIPINGSLISQTEAQFHMCLCGIPNHTTNGLVEREKLLTTFVRNDKSLSVGDGAFKVDFGQEI